MQGRANCLVALIRPRLGPYTVADEHRSVPVGQLTPRSPDSEINDFGLKPEKALLGHGSDRLDEIRDVRCESDHRRFPTQAPDEASLGSYGAREHNGDCGQIGWYWHMGRHRPVGLVLSDDPFDRIVVKRNLVSVRIRTKASACLEPLPLLKDELLKKGASELVRGFTCLSDRG